MRSKALKVKQCEGSFFFFFQHQYTLIATGLQTHREP